MIPALTLRAPWPEEILSGRKRVENRTWRTNHRGLILVHAGLGGQGDGPRGALLGAVTVEDCVRLEPDSAAWNRLKGYAMEHHWHWLLSNPVRLPEPIPCLGRLSLWTPSPDVLEEAWVGLRGRLPAHAAQHPQGSGSTRCTG